MELLYVGTYTYGTKLNVSVLVRALAEYRYGDAHMDGRNPHDFVPRTGHSVSIVRRT